MIFGLLNVTGHKYKSKTDTRGNPYRINDKNKEGEISLDQMSPLNCLSIRLNPYKCTLYHSVEGEKLDYSLYASQLYISCESSFLIGLAIFLGFLHAKNKANG